MKRYSIEEIRKWLSAYGCPGYICDHLSEESLDKFSIYNPEEDPGNPMFKSRIASSDDKFGWGEPNEGSGWK